MRGLPRVLRVLGRVVLGSLAVLVFVLALELLKKGARSLAPFITGTLSVDAFPSAVGFGWLFAYVVLSGSPVAAIGLTLLASGVLDDLQTFGMIAGSRFGASFVVLLLGLVYALRGRERRQTLEMGILSLLTTFSIYALAIPLGALLLVSGAFDAFRPEVPSALFDAIDLAYGPLVAAFAARLPAWGLFVAGVLLVLSAFHLFDRCLPEVPPGGGPIRNLEAHVFRPSVMFAIGAVVTLFTLSVSVSLGILVPLSAKGIARRENVIPYIMGANITTFVDTLFASLLLNHPRAFTIVLVEMLAVAAVSLAVLLFAFVTFERLLLSLSRRILATRGNLILFHVVIFVAPLLLLAM